MRTGVQRRLVNESGADQSIRTVWSCAALHEVVYAPMEPAAACMQKISPQGSSFVTGCVLSKGCPSLRNRDMTCSSRF